MSIVERKRHGGQPRKSHATNCSRRALCRDVRVLAICPSEQRDTSPLWVSRSPVPTFEQVVDYLETNASLQVGTCGSPTRRGRRQRQRILGTLGPATPLAADLAQHTSAQRHPPTESRQPPSGPTAHTTPPLPSTVFRQISWRLHGQPGESQEPDRDPLSAMWLWPPSRLLRSPSRPAAADCPAARMPPLRPTIHDDRAAESDAERTDGQAFRRSLQINSPTAPASNMATLPGSGTFATRNPMWKYSLVG